MFRAGPPAGAGQARVRPTGAVACGWFLSRNDGAAGFRPAQSVTEESVTEASVPAAGGIPEQGNREDGVDLRLLVGQRQIEALLQLEIGAPGQDRPAAP